MKKILFLFCLASGCFVQQGGCQDPPTSVRKPLIIILFGTPGTGPGDFALRISDEMSLPLISTSSLVQAYLTQESPIGASVRETFNTHGSIPDKLLLDMTYDYIQKRENRSDFILDGIPRTLAQAQSLQKDLSPQFRILCIYIQVKDAAIIQIKSGRVICPNCGRVYHKEFSPPDDPLTCDQCDSALKQLEDDVRENVVLRLNDFHKRATPIFDFFKKEKCFAEIDSTAYVGEEFRDLVNAEIRRTIERFDIDSTRALKLEVMLS